jgi:predicted glycosyltransferase
VVVYGPLFSGNPPPDEPGLCSVRFESSLPELMAAADVVVSSAGYNSVQELMAAGSPGILVPLESPGQDDQRERASRVLHDGRARMAELEPQNIERQLEAVLKGRGPDRRPVESPDAHVYAGQVLAGLLRS